MSAGKVLSTRVSSVSMLAPAMLVMAAARLGEHAARGSTVAVGHVEDERVCLPRHNAINAGRFDTSARDCETPVLLTNWSAYNIKPTQILSTPLSVSSKKLDMVENGRGFTKRQHSREIFLSRNYLKRKLKTFITLRTRLRFR